jgi:hypothetical protein
MRKQLLRRAALRAFVLCQKEFCSKPDFVRRTAEASSHKISLKEGKAES